MKFKEFDTRMRMFEKNLDQYVMPGAYVVVRLDGRSFSKLTEKYFQKPFDDHFKDLMQKTTEMAMSCGFTCIYGYSQSDEISLLFAHDENTFGRKTRKINSTLASTASAVFTLEMNKLIQNVSEELLLGTFDCRVIALPTKEDVMDYFVWRQNDGIRNALNNYCYWTLRKDGMSGKAATSALKSKGYEEKVELLDEHGIDWENIPAWQKYGFGYYYCIESHCGYDPIKNEYVEVGRNMLKKEENLPNGLNYRDMIENLITNCSE